LALSAWRHALKNPFYPTKKNLISFQLLFIPFIHYILIIDRPGRNLGINLTINKIRMKTLLLVKEIYSDGFKNLGNILIKNYFKAFTWFSLILLAVVLYAFIFRVSTGFAFD